MRGDVIRRRRASTWCATRGLRVRLVLVAVCLVAAGAGIIGGGSVLLARAALMRQAGERLHAEVALLNRRPFLLTPGAGLALPGAPAGGGYSVAVLSSTGRLVMRTGPGRQPVQAIAQRARSGPGRLAVTAAGSGGQRWLVITEPVRYRARHLLFTYGTDGFSLLVTGRHRPGVAGTLAVGLDLSGVAHFTGRLALTCLAVSGIVVVAVAALGGAAVRALLRPLAAMAETATAVGAGELAQRVPVRYARGEAGTLTRALNAMLEEIERGLSASAMSEAAARQAGERLSSLILSTGRMLRRPVSVIHGFAWYHRQQRRPGPAELDRMMRRVAAEAARLAALLDDLPAPGGQSHPGANDRGDDRD